MTALLSGNELVLVAQVPNGAGRWTQAHFNRAVMEQFFGLKPGDQKSIFLERVDGEGFLAEGARRKLVYSPTNKNPKLEINFGSVREYPTAGVPLIVVVELDVDRFRYRTLMPDSPGYEAMLQLNLDYPAIGRGHRRIISTLDEVEMRWPQIRLRNPKTRGIPPG